MIGQWSAVAAACLSMAAAAADAQRSNSLNASRQDTTKGPTAFAKVNAALVVDAVTRTQDQPSELQVGTLPTLGRIRFARSIIDGQFVLRRPWTYLIAVDASGLYADGSPALTIVDLALTIPIGGRGRILIGRQKEGFGEDMLAPSRGIPFAERAAPITVFVPTRNDGIRLWGPLPAGTGGWALGIFDDWLFKDVPFHLNGPQGIARAFWAPILSADSNRALHLGAAARWTGSSNGGLAFRTPPEQNEAPNFVNTGTFSASSALTLDGELVATHNAWSLTAEVLPSQAYGTWDGTLDFLGYYAALSWRPHGEARRYDPILGRLDRVRTRPHGVVWEIGVRFSHTNLADQVAEGGVLDIPSFSFGAWGPSHTRVLLNYGFSALRKSGHVGRAQLLTLRFQWEPGL